MSAPEFEENDANSGNKGTWILKQARRDKNGSAIYHVMTTYSAVRIPLVSTSAM